MPKFEYIIIWYHAVDLLKLDPKDVIIFCPGSRSFCYDKTPPGNLLMKGSFLAVVILLCPFCRKAQPMAVSQKLTEPPGPLMARFPRCQSQQNPFLLRLLPTHSGQLLWMSLIIMGGRRKSRAISCWQHADAAPGTAPGHGFWNILRPFLFCPNEKLPGLEYCSCLRGSSDLI